MSTMYPGQSPPQYLAGQGSSSGEPNQSIPPKRKVNRDTLMTDAQTTSTQSPFASPVSSEFRGKPRPPSFPYSTGAPPPLDEFADRRRRRKTRRQSRLHDDMAASPIIPPAAPEPPLAPPPVSYKAPALNGRPNTGTSTVEKPNQSLEGGSTHVNGEEIKVAEPVRLKARNGKVVFHGMGADKWPTRLEMLPSRMREEPLPNAEAKRRREWAPDRSPLQRLELTLDGITKEEKRARIEEAQLVAKEAKAERAADKPNSGSVRFRDHTLAEACDGGKQRKLQDLSEVGIVKSLGNDQNEELEQSTTIEKIRPVPVEARGLDYSPTSDNGVDSNVEDNQTGSKMGSSVFNTAEQSLGSIAALKDGAGAGAVATSVYRDKSNRLRKDASEAWSHQRSEAEKHYSNTVPSDFAAEVGPSKASFLQEALPYSLYTEQEDILPKHYPIEPFDPQAPKVSSTLPMRRSSARKVAQVTGQPLPMQLTKPLPSNPPAREPSPEVVNRKGLAGVRYAEPLPRGDHYHQRQGVDEQHRYMDMLQRRKNADDGIYVEKPRLDEWKQGGVAKLFDDLLDLYEPEALRADKDKAWWGAEKSGKRRNSTRNRAEAYEGEYADSNARTRFKPHLYLECGPLLRYCGLRKERRQGRHSITREIWRGSVMIVTKDSDSSYELAPTLRLFLQPIDILPPPPNQVDGDIAPEYVDPIAGLQKIARDGRTLYVRPVDHIPESIDVSTDESDTGLFERERRNSTGNGGVNGTLAIFDHLKPKFDGEKAGKYQEVRGFRLHTEQGLTFWRFNIEVELRESQQRIAYRINRGPATGFWVPGRHQAMNMMFHSCNGFSPGVNSHLLSGPDPMWRDVLNTHQTQPFHVMLGGGDQIYMDSVMDHTILFRDWVDIRNPMHKEDQPFTLDMQNELEQFYLGKYCKWFSQGLFSLASSQIPMVNIWDDHDIIDGFGSYPDEYMSSPVMSGLGRVAFKYYMIFQHQSSIDEGEEEESSWLLGGQLGPYIPEMSRSIFTFLGRSVAFLGLDCRTERTNQDILSDETYAKVAERLKQDIVKGETKHLIVILGVPIAYPRMVWLENILTSKLMAPVKALGRAGILGKKVTDRLDGGIEVLDDLEGHWTAKHHKEERSLFIQDLQAIAKQKSVRITILSGGVHLAAIGQFYSNPKLGIRKDRDHRYMPNIISSAIVNTPQPDMLANILNKHNKIHHLDFKTDEDMIPIFTHDVDGKPRNNKSLFNRRNWCSIREFDPALATPPPSPIPSEFSSSEEELESTRPSMIHRSPSNKIKPPLTEAGGFFSRGPGTTSRRTSSESQRPPGKLRRTLSLTRQDIMPEFFRSRKQSRNYIENYERDPQEYPLDEADTAPQRLGPSTSKLGGIFPWLRTKDRHRSDSGGINGYGASSDEESLHSVDGDYYDTPRQRTRLPRASGIRGGSGGPEETDDGYFPPYQQPGVSKVNPSNSRRQPPHIPHSPLAPVLKAGQKRPPPNSTAIANGNMAVSTSNEPPVMTPASAYPVNTATTSMAGGTPHDAGIPRHPQIQRLYSFKRSTTEPLPGRGNRGEIDLRGGLDICLNVEVSAKDPSGITMPYRLLVPELRQMERIADVDEDGPKSMSQEDVGIARERVGGLVRKLSLFGKKKYV